MCRDFRQSATAPKRFTAINALVSTSAAHSLAFVVKGCPCLHFGPCGSSMSISLFPRFGLLSRSMADGTVRLRRSALIAERRNFWIAVNGVWLLLIGIDIRAIRDHPEKRSLMRS